MYIIGTVSDIFAIHDVYEQFRLRLNWPELLPFFFSKFGIFYLYALYVYIFHLSE